MDAQLTDTDRAHLGRALDLAEGGRGAVSPNPLVGAVIVRDGEVVGEGFHAAAGDLHAERVALEDCRRRGGDPAGATIYVSLEPCAHTGRQPPCAEALVQAGVARVVIASEDPSGKTAGRGPELLRGARVAVAWADGDEARAARLLNQPFRKHARTGLPHVTLKLAMSLEGMTTTPPGEGPWITGEESRATVHRWRAEADAIAAGIGTVLADDPLLTARPATQHDAPPAERSSFLPKVEEKDERDKGPAGAPRERSSFLSPVGKNDERDEGGPGAPGGRALRVVFDRGARLPLDSRLMATLDRAPVLVVASNAADPTKLAALREAGAETLVAEGVEVALAELGRRGVTSLFLEGGKVLAAAFAAEGQIDLVRTFVAPVLLGGGRRTEAADPAAADTLIEARMREW